MYLEKAKKNIITSILFKIIILILGILSRRFMVNYLGNETTGIYSLFVSIIGFLSVAELGIGSAIIFTMYKPIADNNKDQISALYYLYKKLYSMIFAFIILVGLLITPILPHVAQKSSISNWGVYLAYLIYLASASMTYLHAYKSAFINAHMDNYITNSIRSIFQILEIITQIVVVLLTRSFIYFLLVILISSSMQWITTNIIFNRKYKLKLNNNIILTDELKQSVKLKTKAMFSHKIGGLLVMSAESIIISTFLGVVLLGIYSNYILIVTGITSILSLLFSSVISVLGQAYTKIDKNVFQKRFDIAYLINYCLAFVFFMGFYFISEELITVLFNEDVVLSSKLVIILVTNQFIQFLRQSVLSFRDATGTFYYDRYKPYFEGVINLALSLLFVKFFNIEGVLIATIITNLTITHTVEPYVLYKYAFKAPPKEHYIRNYFGILLFVTALLLSKYIPVPFLSNIFMRILIKGIFSVTLSLTVLSLIYLFNKKFRNDINLAFGILKDSF